MIKNLDGNEAVEIIPGQKYLVPTIGGYNVVLPSHIDEGTDGPTSRHYHVDTRFDMPSIVGREADLIDPRTQQRAHIEDRSTVPTLLDDGRPIVYRKRKAAHSYSLKGSVFTSHCWLYYHLGELVAQDGHCVHHRTPLLREQNNPCLTCPAHGMKYNLDGTPYYKAPFFIEIAGNKGQLSIPKCTIEIDKPFSDITLITLIDSLGQKISSMFLDTPAPSAGVGDLLKLNLDIWQGKGNICPALRKDCENA